MEFRTDYATVTSGWRSMLKGTYGKQRAAVTVQSGLWRDAPHFTGATEDTMEGWVDNGYLVDGMSVKRGAYTRPRRKLRLAEEGELQVDLALSGHDTPFIDWGKRTRTPGLTVDIELAVRASTPTSVLRDYAEWIAALIYGLEGKGFRLDVNIVSRCKGLVEGKRDTASTYIRVASMNRRTDFKTWSAILSPGGFRHLIFAARILNCEANGVQASPGMGGSFGPDWGVEFDPKTRTLTVKCAAATTRFPRERMDQQLAAVKV